MPDVIRWIGASKMPWAVGCTKWAIFFGHRLWRPESKTSSPLRKAKWPNWHSRNVEEWKQWPLETIEETDEERYEKGLIHACIWVFTTDLQRPETQFQSPRSGNNLFEGEEGVSDTASISSNIYDIFPSICCGFGFRDIRRLVPLLQKIHKVHFLHASEASHGPFSGHSKKGIVWGL